MRMDYKHTDGLCTEPHTKLLTCLTASSLMVAKETRGTLIRAHIVNKICGRNTDENFCACVCVCVCEYCTQMHTRVDYSNHYTYH